MFHAVHFSDIREREVEKERGRESERQAERETVIERAI